VHWIDVQLDAEPNLLTGFADARTAAIRDLCARHGVHLGLHTSSAVNVAETAPHVGPAVDRYLEAYVEIAPKIGAEWIVVHAGYHFTSDKELRMAAGRDRLRRLVGHAEKHGALCCSKT
jgi:sugar phosphate isomerase/epimerase